MRFLAPQALWVLLPLAFLPVIWHLLERHARKNLARFASPALFPSLVKDVDFKRRRTKFILGFLALVFGVIAVARPQMGTREETLASEGLDMVVLLDVSNSMLAEDVVPSRLKKAKHLVKSLVERLSGDRIGLVAFAGSAYPAVPLTTDYEFLLQTLEILDETAIANQGSNLSRGVQVGLELLNRGGTSEDDANVEASDDSSSRVMIVLSDGEETEGGESALVPQLKEKGVKVFTIGVGSTKGAPIPMRDPMGYLRGYKKDTSGNMVLSKLESRNLEGLSSKTGAKFYVASSNEGEVEEILGQMSAYGRKSGAGRRVTVYEELYQYPLLLAVLLFMGMLALRETRAKKRNNAGAAAAVVTLLLLAGTGAQAATTVSEYDETKKGLKAYDEKDYASAVQSFGKAQASHPESNVHHLNLGDALLKSGANEAAIAEFEQVAKSKDPSEAAKGAYNLGKAYEAAKNREKALQSYQNGLNRLRESQEKADPEAELRIKKALEALGQSSDKGDDKGDDKNSDQNKNGEQKDNKDQKKDQNQQYQIARRKPQFKPEKLSETDAKRILQQLNEQEKKSQQRVMRGKTGKPDSDKSGKDW